MATIEELKDKFLGAVGLQELIRLIKSRLSELELADEEILYRLNNFNDSSEGLTIEEVINNIYDILNEIYGSEGAIEEIRNEITNIVNNYATIEYVDNAIEGVVGVEYKVCDELPATGEPGVIYLILVDMDSEGTPVYNKYIYLDSSEYVGFVSLSEPVDEITPDEVEDIWNEIFV